MLPKASSLVIHSKSLVAGLLAIGVSGAVSAREIAVVGPIESLNCSAHRVNILGVSFAADTAATAAMCRAGAYSVSSYVSAIGDIDAKGGIQLRRIALVADGSYVSGSSPVFVRGEISQSNQKTGVLSLNGAVIDSQTLSVSVGSVVEVLGIQPLPNGVVVPLAIQTVSAGGSDESLEPVEGIVGTGVWTDSVVGSGISTKSVVGSGIATDSVVGSGTSTNSVVGSGIKPKSVVGSGIATISVVGSGISTNSVIGSGIKPNSVVGSGVATNSVVGSGISINSVVGSGVTTKSVVGSGISTNSVVGSGVATK